jgi:hypothetical protein
MSRRIALIYSFLLAALVLLPSWKEGHLIGHPNLDVWSHAWGMDWFSSSLRSGQFPWYVEGVAWPEKRILWYIDPMGALLMTPFSWFLGPIQSYNILIGTQIFLLGMGMWLLSRRLGSSGWIAMSILCTSPFLLGEYWNGVIEAGWVALIPFAGYLATRSSRWTGIVVGMAALATPYHGVGAALMVTALILGKDTQSWGIRIRRLMIAGFLAILVALPHLLLIRMSIHSPLSFVNRSIYEGYNPAVLISNAVDPWAFVAQGDFWSQTINDTRISVPWHKTPYLGWVGIAGSFGLLFFWKKGILLWLPAIVGIVLTLGIFLWHDGSWVHASNGGNYKLPLAYIAQWAPLPIDHPMRFVGLVTCCFALMADRFFGRWGWMLCGLVLVEQLTWAPNSWPLPTADARLPSLYEKISEDGTAILDLPSDLGVGNRTNRYLFWQRIHGHPVPWGNKVSAIGIASRNQAVVQWASLSRDVEGYVEGLDPNAIISKDTLIQENYGTIVLHLDLLKNTKELEKYNRISKIFGMPERKKKYWIWDIKK